MIKKIGAGFAPSNGAIWDEYNEPHQHQTQKKHFQCMICIFLLQIRVRFVLQGLSMLSNLLF